jgi:hypothetical protein
MPNTIRNPKPGTPSHIREAVDNQEWQQFRLSLKGKPTEDKLHELRIYLYRDVMTAEEFKLRQIRVDNYLKALARGGQIGIAADYLDAFVKDELEVRK